jgi:hypothetical protein
MSHHSCSKCGAPISPQEIYCSFCGHPGRTFFANVEKVEFCKKFLLDMETILNTLPPIRGWGLSLFWFGLPLVLLTIIGLTLNGITGWISGIIAGILLFLLLTPLIAAWRQKIYTQQYQRVVRFKLATLLKDQGIDLQDLVLLARNVEELKTSTILKHLEIIRDNTTIESVK